MEPPLAGTLVLDLAQGVAGPFAARLLAGAGARVIKLEPHSGDVSRQWGPFRDDRPDPEGSGSFLHWNAGKLGVVVDLEAAAGAAVAGDLAAHADVVIESSPPGWLAARGLGPHDLLARRPGLVVTSVTPFGQTGPYRDFVASELVSSAMGGPMHSTGRLDREPVRLPGDLVHAQAGSTACVATLAALLHAELTGEGQHVDVAVHETQNGSIDRRRQYHLAHQYTGTIAQRAPAVGAAAGARGGCFEAADGRFVSPGIGVWPEHVPRMVDVLGDARLRALFEEGGVNAVLVATDETERAIAAWVADRPALDAMLEAQAAGWPMVILNDPLSVLDDPHLRERGYWQELAPSATGPLPHAGPVWRFDEGSWRAGPPAPTLGQDTDAVLRELLGYDDDRLRSLRQAGAIR